MGHKKLAKGGYQ